MSDDPVVAPHSTPNHTQDIPTTSIYLQISPAGAEPQGVNHGL